MTLGINKRYAFWFSAISLFILATVLLATTLVIWRSSRFLRESLRAGTVENFETFQLATMNSLAEYLRRELFTPLYELDIEEITLSLKDLRRGMPILAVYIADASGKVLTDGTWENPSYGMHLQLARERLEATPVLIEQVKTGTRITFQIGTGEYLAGYGEIIFSKAPLQQAIARQDATVLRIWRDFKKALLAIVVTSTFFIAIIAIAMAVVFARTLSRPLIGLRNATRRIAMGDLEHRVQVRSRDELGDLASSFNEMAGELQARTAERQRAEEALRQSEERFRMFADFTYDWEYWISPEGRSIYVSPACEKITGYRQEDFIRDHDLLISLIHPQDRELFVDHLQGYLKESTHAAELEFRIATRQGEERWIAHACRPVHAENGEFMGRRASNRDITDRKKAEEEVQKAQKLESIGLLAGGIAHDFNNILTAIQGNIELAGMDLPPESQARNRLSVARQACERASGLSRQLLTFAKGGAPIKKVQSLPALIHEATELSLRGSNVKSHYLLPADLWPAEIDESQFSQVINNLVINADQAMPQGGTLSILARNEFLAQGNTLGLPEGRYIRLEFKDQGTGIPGTYLGKIFDPYFTTKEKGSGLGLAVCYSIVTKHGGTMTVDSAPGAGSTFSILLPASEEGAAPLEIEEREELREGSGRILVMDDEEAIHAVAAAMLHHLGYQVETVRDGAEAVTAYEQALAAGEPFDIVITDLTVPGGMGGRETARRLLDLDPEAKVIVSSGYANDPIMSDYARYGFQGVIPKPYKIEELGRTLQEVLGRRKKGSHPDAHID